MEYKYYKPEDKCCCPRCKQKILGYPALSRRDNETLICSDCGVVEALEDWSGDEYNGEKYWNINTSRK